MGPAAPNPPQAANDAATQSKGLGGNAHGHWRMSVQWEWVGNERRPCIIYLYVYIYIYGCRQPTINSLSSAIQYIIYKYEYQYQYHIPIQITARASKA